MRALIVEDDAQLAANTALLLKKKLQLSVDIAECGKAGRNKFRNNEYDLVLLDWMLGDIEGTQLCRELRELNPKAAVIILTARSTVSDKLAGFESGADDYLSKPFLFEELAARIKAVLRRRFSPESTEILSIKDLSVNISKHSAVLKGLELELSPKEYALLEYLALNKDQALSRAQILEHVWDENADMFTNTVDVHIRFLRLKLGDEAELIKTVKGKGYMLCAE